MGSVSEPEQPAAIGRFRIVRRLGVGGMGVVYEGIDDMLGRRAAVKILNERTDDEVGRQRFLREARAAAAVSHDNVGTIYEVGEDEERLFLAMEYIDGQTLRALMHLDPPDIPRTLEIATEVAAALAAAHRAGLVHRDLKPDNVMIERGSGRAKVLDFGLAKLAGDPDHSPLDVARRSTLPPAAADAAMAAELTVDGHVLGSPGYMSPEQLNAQKLDARTDVWAFGVLLYELLEGRRPFAHESAVELVLEICTQPMAPFTRTDLPAPLTRLVSTCLGKNADERPRDGDALLEALSAIDVVEGGAAPAHEALAMAPTMEATDPLPIPGPRDQETPKWVKPLAVAFAVASFGMVAVTAYQRGPWNEEPVVEPAPLVATPEAPATETRPTLCPPGSGPTCDQRSVAWCAADGSRVACCGVGLVPTPDALCECPPGGATEPAALDNGCAAPDDETPYRDRVQGVVRRHFSAFRDCYEGSLDEQETLQGRVMVTFTINPWGEVSAARLGGATLPDPNVQRCVLGAWRSMVFPPPAGTEEREVTYPLVFSQ